MELMTTTDLNGRNHSYVASEENFKMLREFERNTCSCRIVGDFGGDKALQAWAYLREHGATANFFYTSNVEQYLFRTKPGSAITERLATLPIDNNSTFTARTSTWGSGSRRHHHARSTFRPAPRSRSKPAECLPGGRAPD